MAEEELGGASRGGTIIVMMRGKNDAIAT
jgi:hypothetical protein